MTDTLYRIDRLRRELDGLRPPPPESVARVKQKLRIEARFDSNAVEGNLRTLGETRSLILHGLTARSKPLPDHLDIRGHNQAVIGVKSSAGRMARPADRKDQLCQP